MRAGWVASKSPDAATAATAARRRGLGRGYRPSPLPTRPMRPGASPDQPVRGLLSWCGGCCWWSCALRCSLSNPALAVAPMLLLLLLLLLQMNLLLEQAAARSCCCRFPCLHTTSSSRSLSSAAAGGCGRGRRVRWRYCWRTLHRGGWQLTNEGDL